MADTLFVFVFLHICSSVNGQTKNGIVANNLREQYTFEQVLFTVIINEVLIEKIIDLCIMLVSA